jgi:hypothetical protein
MIALQHGVVHRVQEGSTLVANSHGGGVGLLHQSIVHTPAVTAYSLPITLQALNNA